MTTPNDRYLTPEQLRLLIDDGDIDTVVMAFTDMQGRLQGKRLHGRYFLDVALEAGTEGCNYLLAVDIDMNTVGGYAMSSWEKGYGDMEFVPDWSTLRLLTHMPATAMVQCDLVWLDHAPVLQSPRTILRHQLDKVADKGMVALAGTELEFIAFDTSYEDAHHLGWRDLTPGQPVQRRLLDPRHQPDRAAAARHPQPHVRRRARRRGRQGRVQLRAARDRLPVRRRDDDRRQPQRLQDGGQGDRRPARPGDHVHGEVRPARGQLLPHPPVAARATTATSSSGTATQRTPLYDHFIAGVLATLREFTLLYAPNVNSYKRFAAGSFAPTAVAWGLDNRTCAVRLVGHGPSARMENRLPGGDVNPYLALAGMLAGGLHGIDNELALEDELVGNAYDSDKPHVPHTLREARELFAGSAIARAAFGDEVVDHYVNMADVELAAFDAHVTDWELARSFERM